MFSKELIEKTKAWLGPKGIKFFREKIDKYKKEWGTACWSEGGIPHSIHFNEGMQVRNFIRDSKLHDNLDAHHLDDNWHKLIEEVVVND